MSTQPALHPMSDLQTVAWRREWQGDDSDLGKYVYVEDAEEREGDLSLWEPLVTSESALASRAALEAEIERLRQLLREAIRPDSGLEFGDLLARIDAALAEHA